MGHAQILQQMMTLVMKLLQMTRDSFFVTQLKSVMSFCRQNFNPFLFSLISDIVSKKENIISCKLGSYFPNTLALYVDIAIHVIGMSHNMYTYMPTNLFGKPLFYCEMVFVLTMLLQHYPCHILNGY